MCDETMEKGGSKPVCADQWFSWFWFDAVKEPETYKSIEIYYEEKVPTIMRILNWIELVMCET